MTVLDQVLTAEEEASKTISTAQDDAATTVAEARTAQRETIAAAEAQTKEEGEKALADFQGQIDRKTGEIRTQAQTQVDAIERKFTEANAEVVSTIKQALS